MDPVFTSNFEAKKAAESVNVIHKLVMSRNRDDAVGFSKTIATPIYNFCNKIAEMNMYKGDFDYLVEKNICDPQKNDKDMLVLLSIMMPSSPYPLYLLCNYYSDRQGSNLASYNQAYDLLNKIPRADAKLYLGILESNIPRKISLLVYAYNNSNSRYIKAASANLLSLLHNGREKTEWSNKATEALSSYREQYDNPI